MEQWSRTAGKGMPVYIGEWGVGWRSELPSMNCNNIRRWYDSFINEQAIARGLPTAVWDNGGWFRVFDQARNTWDNDLIDCMANGCAIAEDGNTGVAA